MMERQTKVIERWPGVLVRRVKQSQRSRGIASRVIASNIFPKRIASEFGVDKNEIVSYAKQLAFLISL